MSQQPGKETAKKTPDTVYELLAEAKNDVPEIQYEVDVALDEMSESIKAIREIQQALDTEYFVTFTGT